MFARPKADCADHREPTAGRIANEVDRRPGAAGERRRGARQPLRQALEPGSLREAREPAFHVVGNQRGQQAEDQDRPGDRGRHDRQPDGGLAAQHAHAEQHAEHDERDHVDGIQQDEECHHPLGRLPPLHAGLSQSPVGEHDPAGPCRGEQATGGQARHCDLVRLAPLEAGDALADHAAEERDVREEHRDVETERDDEPPGGRVGELAHGALDADDLREEDVDRREEQEHHQAGLERAVLATQRRRARSPHPHRSDPDRPHHGRSPSPLILAGGPAVGVSARRQRGRNAAAVSQLFAIRSSRCARRLIRSAAGRASGSPRRTATTRAAPTNRSMR